MPWQYQECSGGGFMFLSFAHLSFGVCCLQWHLAGLCCGGWIALFGMWDGAGEGGVAVSSLVTTQGGS